MASHATKLAWWGDRICGDGRVDVVFMGRSPVRIQPEMASAVDALEHALLSNGYALPIGVTGSYSCRKISGSNTWSLHAVPIAIDVDYANNRVQSYRVERGFGVDPNFLVTEAMVDAAEAIVNSDGVSIWKWLGWRASGADPMHFEIDVPPDKCQPVDMEDTMPKQQWDQFIDSLFIARPDEFQPPGGQEYWKQLDPNSNEWADFWNAFMRVIS